uniref:Neur_chan_LBD domain-containing protein n=1 Tax=Steinernema glaseri TaxID=37863 RepID=A0A1I7YMT1_9BILA
MLRRLLLAFLPFIATQEVVLSSLFHNSGTSFGVEPCSYFDNITGVHYSSRHVFQPLAHTVLRPLPRSSFSFTWDSKQLRTVVFVDPPPRVSISCSGKYHFAVEMTVIAL